MTIKVISYETADTANVVKQNKRPEEVKPKETQNLSGPIFMEPGDVSTASLEDAKKIGEFLNNKETRKLREAELAGYLLMQKYDGGKVYSVDEAEKLAKYQVKNEVDQARAKVTIPFIDKETYENFKSYLKEQGLEDIYIPKLIKNKKVLKMINGENITDPAEKEANYKKYFMTDVDGNLIKGKNGQYVFDPEKYKEEMSKDTTAYRLTLADRAEHSKERGISKNAEKDAIKATGLGYRKDRTWLYRGILLGAGAATAIWGGAAATAVAGAAADATTGGASAGAGAVAKATAKNRLGQILGPIGFVTAAALVKDRDGKHDHRAEAQEVFETELPEIIVTPEKVEEKPAVEEKPPIVVVTPDCDEKPCLDVKQLPPEYQKISTIVGGGPYHYTQLYVDKNGNPLQKGSKAFKDLQKKLSSGEDSIQTIDRKHRELKKEITLSDGTKVKLADNADEIARRGFDDARVEKGKGDRKYKQVQRDGEWIVVYCDNGKVVPGSGKYKTEDEAVKAIPKLQESLQ